MSQPSLVGNAQIVNVASVPQRSPFRYPGGKTWLVPRIRQWMRSRPTLPAELIEPFTGGGIVGLTVAFEQLADRVTLVELDDQIAAVWETILGEDAAWLGEAIAAFDLTPESVAAALGAVPPTRRELAFQTILKNRVNRGGILAAGAGRIKHGENGKGLNSRWYPQTLRRRILDIAAIGDRMEFIHGDGIAVLRQARPRAEVVAFIDPPYTAAGKRAGSRLYRHANLDHEALFHVAHELAGDFLMTYDDTLAIRALARRHGFATATVAMKNTHHAPITELLIARNLDWLDS